MSENDNDQVEIGLTDYEKPMFCSGCEQYFDVGETLQVADFGSSFPTFCSSECASDEAEKYHVEHLVDERDGVEFVRLVYRHPHTDR